MYILALRGGALILHTSSHLNTRLSMSGYPYPHSMDDAEDYEIIVSSDLDVPPRPTDAQRTVVIVLTDTIPLQHSLLHRIDRLGHIVVAPCHPDRPITTGHGFTNRCYFYHTAEPFASMSAEHWLSAKAHIRHITNQPVVLHIIVIGTPSNTADLAINTFLSDFHTQRRLEPVTVIAEAFREFAYEPYHSVVRRYQHAVKQQSLWRISRVNGMQVRQNGTLFADAITIGALRRHGFCHRQIAEYRNRELMDKRVDCMLQAWEPSPQHAFRQGERIFLTLQASNCSFNN